VVVFALLSGCASEAACPQTPYVVRVEVGLDGQVTVDGQPFPLEMLSEVVKQKSAEFAALKARCGSQSGRREAN
jgi:hypothetical protein